jgi:hypothetical protein
MAFGLARRSPGVRVFPFLLINLISESHFLPGFKNDPVGENLFDYFRVAVAQQAENKMTALGR